MKINLDKTTTITLSSTLENTTPVKNIVNVIAGYQQEEDCGGSLELRSRDDISAMLEEVGVMWA